MMGGFTEDSIVIALNLYFSLSKNDEIKHFLENFRLSWGQPFSKIRLPPPNLTRDGQVGNCLFLTLSRWGENRKTPRKTL